MQQLGREQKKRNDLDLRWMGVFLFCRFRFAERGMTARESFFGQILSADNIFFQFGFETACEKPE